MTTRGIGTSHLFVPVVPKAFERIFAEFGVSYLNTYVQPVVPASVQLTRDIGDHLTDLYVYTETVAGALSGYFGDVSPPAGFRWRVHAYIFERVTGDVTIDAVRLRDTRSGAVLGLAAFTAASRYISGALGSPLPIDDAIEFQFLYNAGTTAGTFKFDALVEEIKISASQA